MCHVETELESSLQATLKKYHIDDIEDDEKFMRIEHEVIRDYHIGNDGKISDDDMVIIKARGLDEWLDDWNSYIKEAV